MGLGNFERNRLPDSKSDGLKSQDKANKTVPPIHQFSLSPIKKIMGCFEKSEIKSGEF